MYAHTPIAALSTGTRRIVELACLLAEEPVLMLLDEPSAGVAQRETEALGPLLRRICDHTGAAMLVIEHDMPLLAGLCDRLVAMELGEVLVEGAPTEVLDHPAVIAAYLGHRRRGDPPIRRHRRPERLRHRADGPPRCDGAVVRSRAVEVMGVEPTTSSMRPRRSSQLSYTPVGRPQCSRPRDASVRIEWGRSALVAGADAAGRSARSLSWRRCEPWRASHGPPDCPP